jgi:hypothetical protein
MDMGTPIDPAGANDEREHESRDDTDAGADIGKRTNMESDGEIQAVVKYIQGQNSGEPKSDKGNAGAANVTDMAAEVTVSSDPTANPIEHSITEYRSGWASFFSSRRLIVKTLGYGPPPPEELGNMKRDENGIEVMEIDFEEDTISADKLDDQDQKRTQFSGGSANSRTIESEVKSGKGAPSVFRTLLGA